MIMKICTGCEKQTMHTVKKTNHVLHLILSLVSFGVWLPVWFVVTQWGADHRAACTVCGRTSKP